MSLHRLLRIGDSVLAKYVGDQPTTRMPVTLVFTIDTSASMDSIVPGTTPNMSRRDIVICEVTKLLTDLQKQAVNEDRLIVVTYDTTATVRVPCLPIIGLDIPEFHRCAREEWSRGCTNISAANTAVRECLRQHAAVVSNTQVFEVSFTDGHATSGLTHPKDIATSKKSGFDSLGTLGIHPILFTYAISSASDVRVAKYTSLAIGTHRATYRRIDDTDMCEFSAELGRVVSLIGWTEVPITIVHESNNSTRVHPSRLNPDGAWARLVLPHGFHPYGLHVPLMENAAATAATDILGSLLRTMQTGTLPDHLDISSLLTTLVDSGVVRADDRPGLLVFFEDVVAHTRSSCEPDQDTGGLRELGCLSRSVTSMESTYRERYRRSYETKGPHQTKRRRTDKPSPSTKTSQSTKPSP